MASPNFALISSKRSSRARVSATPSSTLPSTSLAGVELRLLRQVADRDALGGPGLAVEVLVSPAMIFEQRALAGAVEAQHADLGAGEERQPDLLQDLPVRRVDLAQVLHDVDVLLCHTFLD